MLHHSVMVLGHPLCNILKIPCNRGRLQALLAFFLVSHSHVAQALSSCTVASRSILAFCSSYCLLAFLCTEPDRFSSHCTTCPGHPLPTGSKGSKCDKSRKGQASRGSPGLPVA